MNQFFQQIRERWSAAVTATGDFYRAHRTILLSAVTVVSILLIVWARLGFTFQFSQFFAASNCSGNPDFTGTLSLSADKTTIAAGETVTLTWESNADYCNISGGNLGGDQLSPSGTITDTPSSTTIYSITCPTYTGSASGSCSDSVQVQIGGASTPLVTNEVSGENITLTCNGPTLIGPVWPAGGSPTVFRGILKCATSDAIGRCDQANTAWYMNWGDGTGGEACGGGSPNISWGGCAKDISHTYAKAGTYTVSLSCSADYIDYRRVGSVVVPTNKQWRPATQSITVVVPDSSSAALTPTPTATTTTTPTPTGAASSCIDWSVVSNPFANSSGGICRTSGDYTATLRINDSGNTPFNIEYNAFQCSKKAVGSGAACWSDRQNACDGATTDFLSDSRGMTVNKTNWGAHESGDLVITYTGNTYSCGRVQVDAAFKGGTSCAGNAVFWAGIVDYGVDCSAPTSTPTRTPTPTPTATPTPSQSVTPTPTATPTPTPTPTPTVTITPTPVPGMSLLVSGRNVTTASVESSVVQVLGGHQVDIISRVRNTQTAALTNVTVRAVLPNGLTYVPGSTLIGGVPTTADSITTTGILLGSMIPGQEIPVVFRANVIGAQFVIGSTQVQVGIVNTADSVPANTGAVAVVVTRPGQPGTVQTGPGDAVLAALLVSAIMTLLYVSYTHTAAFKRREVETITRDRDPMDFRS